jgi:hypothetical protein
MSKPMIFQTPEVAKLLRASRFTLNRLMLRCQIETSFGSRGGRGSRILFSVDDVCTLGLAYWLFRSGLRSPAIKDALADKHVKEFCEKLASVEEIEKTAGEVEFLVSWRVAKGRNAHQEVKLETDIAGVRRVLEVERQYGFVVIPVGRLLKELVGAIRQH